MKNFLLRIWKNSIVRNLCYAFLTLVTLLVIVSFSLDFITQHNKSFVLEDFSNLSLEEVREKAKVADLHVIVIDSLYVNGMAPGAVYMQNPKAGSRVKRGRKVRLTINALMPKKVKMPNLIGYSMRQARAELASKALVLGRLIYRDDIATNNVIAQHYKGREIEPNTLITASSVIDLVVGLNSNDNKTYIPNVIGFTKHRAIEAIFDNSLNIDFIYYDKNVKSHADSLNAVVYRQEPSSDEQQYLMGSKVTLYLTLEEKDLKLEKEN